MSFSRMIHQNLKSGFFSYVHMALQMDIIYGEELKRNLLLFHLIGE